MAEHPKFVCKREGHVPSVTNLRGTLLHYMTSFFCSCLRCGDVAEFPLDEVTRG